MIKEGDFGGSDDIILLGANWFFSYYVNYDIGNMKIGFFGKTEELDSASLNTISSFFLLIMLIFMIDI